MVLNKLLLNINKHCLQKAKDLCGMLEELENLLFLIHNHRQGPPRLRVILCKGKVFDDEGLQVTDLLQDTI